MSTSNVTKSEAHKALVGALLDVVEAENVSIRKGTNQAI